MHLQLKHIKSVIPAIFAGMLCISACENDLNKVREIAAADATKPIQRTTMVDLIYSDSAKVKFQVQAPLLYEYRTAKNPYKEMPKGVKVIFYDANQKVMGNIIADSALMKNEDKLIEFRHNVVATNTEGSVYKSDQLNYDLTKKQAYSNKNVEMTKINGDVYRGTSFVSDDKMLHPVFQNTTAIIHVNGENLAQ